MYELFNVTNFTYFIVIVLEKKLKAIVFNCNLQKAQIFNRKEIGGHFDELYPLDNTANLYCRKQFLEKTL